MEDDGDVSSTNIAANATASSTASTSTTINKGLSTAAQRKHEAMLERLSKRSTARQEPDSASAAPPLESAQSFLPRFSQFKSSIESRLSHIRQIPDPRSYPDLKSELDSVSVSISDLEKLVAENSYYLPPYEIRTCLNSILDLKQTLENVSSQVIPKKRFSFKNRHKKAESDAKNHLHVPQLEALTSDRLIGSEMRKCECKVDNQNRHNGSAAIEKSCPRIYESPGFRGKQNEVLVKELKNDFQEIGEFTLSNLDNCEVRLIGCGLRALFLNKLKDCKIYVGPVTGSILIEEVESSVLVLASHQIRIHHAKKCDFYLRARSRPIIEDSNGVRFAPYCLNYDGIERDLEEASLGEETGNWGNVDDFRWLRAVQSPNWSILPESERLESVHISSC